jgi:predicted kinase
MSKVILLCGKICSGKSTYASKIKTKYNAVVLSCDELMLELFDEQLGDRHDAVLRKVKSYLYRLAEQMVAADANVILDFGFWTRSERREVKLYFSEKGIETELHYIHISPEAWARNIEKRNNNRQGGQTKSYYVDDNMKQIFSERFEEPGDDEIDLLIDNSTQI